MLLQTLIAISFEELLIVKEVINARKGAINIGETLWYCFTLWQSLKYKNIWKIKIFSEAFLLWKVKTGI